MKRTIEKSCFDSNLITSTKKKFIIFEKHKSNGDPKLLVEFKPLRSFIETRNLNVNINHTAEQSKANSNLFVIFFRNLLILKEITLDSQKLCTPTPFNSPE